MILGIRADGGLKIGLGHIYKSIWLANALKRKGFKIVFLTTEDQVSNSLIASQGFETVIFSNNWSESQKIQRLNQWVFQQNPKFLVIDHWSWPKEFWSELNRQDKTTYVGMDVPPEGIGYFDLAFQGIRETVESGEYSSSGCRVFNGLDYLVMSPEFKKYKNGWKFSTNLKKVLLTFGGTDVANFSLQALEFFDSKPWNFEIDLALGPGVSNNNDISKKISESKLNVNLMSNVSCLPKLMTSVDLVIATAGLGTLSEIALTSAPAILVSAVSHQKDNAFKFKEHGIVDRTAKSGVWPDEMENDLKFLLENPSRLKELSAKWDGAVDGEGISRILKVLESYAN
jgi:UDP-2,4-diacetamido-2,4,6-trideoxy-beta-L-altropyranose hydrolase